MDQDDAVKKIKDGLIQGKIPPWNAEKEATKMGIAAPANIVVGTLARRAFVEEKSGHKFFHIILPEHPYHTAYRCPQDGTLWTLAADDTYQRCGMCATPLEVLPENERHQPLVNNYIGGAAGLTFFPPLQYGRDRRPGAISPRGVRAGSSGCCRRPSRSPRAPS